jgi:hypothetical protein
MSGMSKAGQLDGGYATTLRSLNKQLERSGPDSPTGLYMCIGRKTQRTETEQVLRAMHITADTMQLNYTSLLDPESDPSKPMYLFAIKGTVEILMKFLKSAASLTGAR